jgi:hypothetical protein
VFIIRFPHSNNIYTDFTILYVDHCNANLFYASFVSGNAYDRLRNLSIPIKLDNVIHVMILGSI